MDTSARFLLRFGRYQDLEFIGEGGMARVYKGYDPVLGRTVALKFIRGEDPLLAERLVQEARAHARIEHENICRVYEAGEIDGKKYIAMQYIDGQSLKAANPELNIEQKVKILAQVSHAMHAAHRTGLIHRDIKPANIMLERNEDGEWVPYVLDFGLARQMQAPGLTATGIVVGSIFYMSPEQARGEVHALDRRADVYSLGVTLYEILTGKLPFEAQSSADVIVMLLGEEPESLTQRDPNLPAELNIIVMKCLEKEPARRYDSARALAEDLERYLDGEPIQARAAGILYRLSKKIRKHKTISALLAGAFLLLLFFAFLTVYTQITARRQTELANRLALQVKQIETILRYAHMMPLHDIRPEKQLVRRKINEIETEMNSLGKPGFGPAHAAIGQGYLALREYEPARTHLELAWNSGYRQPSVAHAMGMALGALYQQALEQAAEAKEPETREKRKREAENNYLHPALEYLKLGRNADLESPLYASALIAFYEKRYEEALQKLSGGRAETPWLYEPAKLEGDVLVMRGLQKEQRGEWEEAEKDYASAGEKYGEAIKIGTGDPGIYESECGRWIRVLAVEESRGLNPETSFENAVAACDQSLQADPENEEAYQKKAYVLWRYADIESTSYGKDPRSHLEESRKTAEKLLQVNPKSKKAHERLGASWWTEGYYQLLHGADPRPLLQRSIADFQTATSLGSNSPDIFVSMGIAYGITASYGMQHGVDTESSLRNAADNFRNAIRLDPAFQSAYHDLALVCMMQGESQMSSGKDPSAVFDEGIQASNTMISRNPRYSEAYSDLGQLYLHQGVYRAENGMDPEPSFRQAITTLNKAAELRPSFAYVYDYLSIAHYSNAQYEWSIGRDPTANLKSAMELAQKAIQANADFPEPYVSIAVIHRIEALWLLDQKRDPLAALSAGRTSLQKAKQINPSLPSIYLELSQLEWIAAEWQLKNGKSPDNHLREAASALERAQKANPKNASVYDGYAEHFRRIAEWKMARKQPAEEEIKQGLANAKMALSIQPSYAHALAEQGLLLILQGETLEGQKSLQEALRRNKFLSRQYANYLP